MERSIGILEYKSIAAGIEAADVMLKTADVEIATLKTICPGKFIVIVNGPVGGVNAAISAGREVSSEMRVDEVIIPFLHEDVFPALAASSEIKNFDALGIIETFSVTKAIQCADAAAKAADVTLIEIRMAQGLGGKGLLTFTGDVAAVRASLEAGCAQALQDGMLVHQVLIPSAHPDLKYHLV